MDYVLKRYLKTFTWKYIRFYENRIGVVLVLGTVSEKGTRYIAWKLLVENEEMGKNS